MQSRWKVLAAAGAVSLLVALSGTYFYTRESASLHSIQRREIRTIARLKIDQLVQWRNEKLGEVRVISQSPYFGSGVRQWIARKSDPTLMRRLTKGLKLYNTQFGLQDIIIASPDGRLLISADSSITAIDSSSAARIRQAVARNVETASDCYYCPTHHRFHYDFIAPFHDENKQIDAVVIFRTDPRTTLFPLIESLPRRSTTIESEIVQQDGDSVLFLNELRFREKGALVLRKSLNDKDNEAVKAVLGFKGIFEGRDYRGVEVIAYVAPVPDTKQMLITKIDHSELYDQLIAYAAVVGILTVSLMLLIGACFAFFYRSRQKRIYESLFLKEKELREHHEEFVAILSNIEDGVISTDLACRVKKMNRAAEELTGWRQADAAGMTIDGVLTMIHESTKSAVVCPASKVLLDGSSIRLRSDILLISKEGKTVPITNHTSPIRNENGEIEGAIIVLRDKSEEQRTDRALRTSQERYRMLFERSHDAIFVVDTASGKYLDANHAAEVLLGRSVEEIKQLTTRDVSPKGAHARLAQMQQMRDSLQLGEVEYVRPDGTVRIAMLDSISINKGEIIGIARDITESRRTEIALRENEEKFRGLIENSPDAIAIYVGGRIVYVNNETVRLMAAASKGELMGRPVLDFAHPESRALIMERMKSVAKDGIPLPIEQEKFVRLDGTVVDVEVKAMQITFEQQPAVQLIVRDITDRRRLEEQLLQAQKLEGVGTLAGGIAHDFNNLLAMVLGSAELLQRQITGQPVLKKHVDRIIEASERGSSISRQLLLFSRPDQAKLVPISLSHTITELQEMLKHFLPKSIQITSKIEAESGVIMGDGGQIHQALLNLALNAGDAMMNHGVLTIREFSAAPSFMQRQFPTASPVPYIAVSVSDTGAGMDAAVLAKIFDPFFSTKERGKGTGLGLAMVHGIVKNHHGFIDVDSTPGKGTIFTLYFPAMADAPANPGAPMAPQPQRRAESILLVDDEEHLREMTTEYLTELGYQTHAASNGTDALEFFREHHRSIDLVITDLGMPQMGGEELFRKLKEIDGNVKVMVSSGYLDGVTKEHLVQMGIKDVLTKPSKLNEIEKAIRRVIEGE